MQVIDNLAALDTKLRECQEAQRVSDDALRGVFNTFRFDAAPQMPPDPFSAEYARRQMALYETIAGRRYDTGNEETVFDVEAARLRPFPYTASPAVGGTHLSAIAFMLRGLNLPPGARVLDVGPGWGNTSLALAQFGFEVTTLDIEPRFCALIGARARALGVPVEIVNDDFFWIERAGRRFDAIIFFESFHHCADHARLLQALPGALKEGGRVYFGAEPIVRDFPLPWGVRTDGESLWAIRQNGWLELGFRESYFREALRRAGMSATIRRSLDVPWITVWEATVGAPEPLRLLANDPRLHSQTGTLVEGRLRLTGQPGYGLYGPYLPLSAGRYRAVLRLAAAPPARGRARFEVAIQGGTRILASRDVELFGQVHAPLPITLVFELENDETAIETRLLCKSGFEASIDSVEILEEEMEGGAA
jgi:2-polyprenyl-3-methyl-5-hydroxy-6-metoxy-1,4-benzoquinol methylase